MSPRERRIRAAARRGGVLLPAVAVLLVGMMAIIALSGIIGLPGAALGGLAAFALADAVRGFGARAGRRAVDMERARLGALEAQRASLLRSLSLFSHILALASRQATAERSIAPPPSTPGGRALPTFCLTPRLLAQRPQFARACAGLC